MSALALEKVHQDNCSSLLRVGLAEIEVAGIVVYRATLKTWGDHCVLLLLGRSIFERGSAPICI